MEVAGSDLLAGWKGTGERMDFCTIFVASEVKLFTGSIFKLPLTSKNQ